MSVNVKAQAWGAGGSGAYKATNDGFNGTVTGGGGAGFGQVNAFPVSSGVGYTVVVGQGGASVTTGSGGVNGNNGGDSYFNSTVTARGIGGGAGQWVSGSGAASGGTAGTGVGDVTHNGAAGTSSASGFHTTAGGGGAGSGGNASGTGGGTPDGGNATSPEPGTSPQTAGAPGGGGSGASLNNGTGSDRGGNGKVVISAAAGAISSATGGTFSTDGTTDFWTFTTPGTFTWTPTIASPPLTITVSDTTTVTDTPIIAETDTINVTETTPVTDVVDMKEHLLINVSDTTAVTDVPNTELVYMFTVSDTTTVTDNVVTRSILKPNVTDTTPVTDNVSITEFTYLTSDLPASLIVSDYKWLTATLKAAQLGPAYRPYYTCKIVDDTITPNQVITAPGVPLNGAAVQSPDGYVLAVGDDGTGKLQFWKLADASTGWGSPTKQLASSYRNDLNASIEVSEYVMGSYVIDVYYFFNNAGALNIGHQRSMDGGITWSSSIACMDPSISNATTDNMCLAAGKPVLLPGGNVSGMVFYLKKAIGVVSPTSYYRIFYQYYTGSGGTFNTPVQWEGYVDSQDWTMQGLDVEYNNGSYYVVFSGYHNNLETVPNQNFGLYATRFDFDRNTTGGGPGSDFWSLVVPVFTATSNTTTNLNVFTNPRFSKIGSVFYLTFTAVMVEAVTTATLGQTNRVITQTFQMIMQTKNGLEYTYPAPLIATDGTIFSYGGAYNFVPNGAFAYTIGNGKLWQYNVNNIVADVTNSLISYEVDEMAGSASQINLVIGNMNNQWVGPSPTKTGAAAIAKNRKIYLEQGYYNASGVGEVVPRNIFYIDDIQQKVDSTTNIVTITARDYVKKLKVLSTKFAFSFAGPVIYSDIFYGNTLGNWNQLSGGWIETSASLKITDLVTANGLISLAGVNNNAESSILAMIIHVSALADPTASIIYPIYQDSNNNVFFRFTIIDHTFHTMGYQFGVKVNGTENIIISGTTAALNTFVNFDVPVMIRKRNYNIYDVVWGSPYQGAYAAANLPGTFDPTAYTGSYAGFPVTPNTGANDLDVSQYFTSSNYVVNGPPAVEFQAVPSGNIKYFKFFQFADRLSIQDLVRKLGTMATVLDYRVDTNFFDTSFLHSNYNGTYAAGGGMTISPSQTVMNTSNPFNNGELNVRAKVVPSNNSNDYSLSILFRADSASAPSKYYRVEMKKSPSKSLTACRFFTDIPTEYMMIGSSLDGYTRADGGSNIKSNPLPIDITKYHTYKLVLIDQYIYFFVDDRLELMWQDNNLQTTSADWSNGFWGIKTDSNSTVVVSQADSPMMWNSLDVAVFNPGDDADNTIRNAVGTVKGFVYGDLMGRLNARILNSTDESGYTYEGILYSQEYDNSDKEYVNQVTVYGNGVSAIARDGLSISETGKVRDMTISDYKILTYEDALSRAQSELINANRFNTQNMPMNPNNVGSEIFDVVTIIDTGDNSTNVDGDFRVYNQNITNDGSKGRYSIQIETGTV